MPAHRTRHDAGYAYLALLFAVVLIGAGLGGAAQVWHTEVQRDRERQLLWVGNQYRKAIEAYWRAGGPAGAAAGAPGAGVPGPAGTSGAVGVDPAAAQGQPVRGVGGSAGLPGASGDPTAIVNGNLVSGTAAAGAGGTTAPAGPSRYPPTLEALLSDPRFQQVRRYLRKLYPDPVTGKADWILIRATNGGIMGVHSSSDAHPFKMAGFSPADILFTGKEKYSDWTFIFVPPTNVKGKTFQPAPPPNFGPAPASPPLPSPATATLLDTLLRCPDLRTMTGVRKPVGFQVGGSLSWPEVPPVDRRASRFQ